MFISDVEEDDSVTIDDVQTLRQVIYYYPNNKYLGFFFEICCTFFCSFLLTISKNDSEEAGKSFSEFVSNLRGTPLHFMCQGAAVFSFFSFC